jgi:hypothetical protein
VYTRIVGYYRSLKNWNKGKRDEYEQRKTFSIDEIREPKEIEKKERRNTFIPEKAKLGTIVAGFGKVAQ